MNQPWSYMRSPSWPPSRLPHWASWLRAVILRLWQILCYYFLRASLVAQMVKISCSAGDLGSVPGLGRSPGEWNGNPLQDSCLENPMDRGAWLTSVHGVVESDITEWLTHTHPHVISSGIGYVPFSISYPTLRLRLNVCKSLNFLLSSVCFSFFLPELNSGLLTYLPLHSFFSSLVLICC